MTYTKTEVVVTGSPKVSVWVGDYEMVPTNPSEKQLDAFLEAMGLANFCCGCSPKATNYKINNWLEGIKAMIAAGEGER